jgi:uncharacterized protein (DUF1015 family)
MVAEPERGGAAAESIMRPPDLLIASPPLAECLARSTHTSSAPRRGDPAGLEPFHHLAPGWEAEHRPEPAAHSLELVRQDAARLRRLAGEGGHGRRLSAATVVYRLEADGHRQTGLVVEGAVADYRSGRIRRHEDTNPQRERLLADFLSAAELELVPVSLVHPTRPRLASLLAEAAAEEPDLRLGSDDGRTQTAWVVRSAPLERAIWAEVDVLADVYIADGHHRMAAAARHAHAAGPSSGHAAAGHVLCVLFPSDEMRVLGYHRCVARAGVPAADMLEAIAAQPAAERLEACDGVPPTAPGVVAVRLDGRWYRLWLRSRDTGADARAALDIVALEDGVLRPLLETGDAGPDARVTSVPGDIGADGFADWCAQHDAVGFLVHPPTIEQIMAVSDAGSVMPPKSTWFEPKARAGPFVRDISAHMVRGR